MHRVILLVVSVWLAVTGNIHSLQVPAAPLVLSKSILSPVQAEAAPGFSVRFHPDGGLFVGDQVSFEVIFTEDPPAGLKLDLNHHSVEVKTGGLDGTVLGSAEFGPGPGNGQFRASLQWAWDTRDLLPGPYTLNFAISETGVQWDQTVTLGPASELPEPEPDVHWEMVKTDCCVLHYLTHTAAERDLDHLISIANQEAQDVSRRFGVKIDKPITITFLSRVLGHGGFASNDIYVSYLDRNYAGSTAEVVLHHEMVHFVDAKLGGELRPEMLIEGLATYLTEGHFKPDPLIADAAALLDMGWYIPLRTLADSFYPAQHEIGYLESAAFIAYLVNTWGWDEYSSFYRDIHPQPSQRQSDAIDAALKSHFGLTFAQAEDRFLNFLKSQAVIPDIRTDIAASVRFYDTMRLYQQLMDPSAYFRQVWLPNSDEMRKRGITADYLRHPDSPEHQALETLMIAADSDVRSGRYDEANRTLSAIQEVLNAVKMGDANPFTGDPLATRQLQIAKTIDRCGLEAQKIGVEDFSGQAEAIRDWPVVEEVPLTRVGDTWQLHVPCRGPTVRPQP